MASCRDCKNCIHYSLCNYEEICHYDIDNIKNAKDCSFFKDRSRFVELPCKVGNIVYCLTLPEKRMVTRIIVTRYGLRISVNDMFSFDMSQIGKTIFLTKEQAEQALKEREGGA